MAQRIDPTTTGAHGGRHRSGEASVGPTGPPTSKQHAAPPRHRRLVVVVALVAVGGVAALVLSGALTALMPNVLDAGGSEGPGPVPDAAASGSAAPPPQQRSPAATPAAGGVSAVQSRAVVVRLRGPNALRVHERLVLGDSALRLDLALAQSSGLLPGFDPVVRRLRLGGPGQPGRPVEPVVSGGSRSVPLPSGATAVFLDYTLGGVVVDTEPSVAGRALAWLTPLQVGAVEDWTVTVATGQVLNLGCSRPGTPLRACGRRAGARWTVTDTTAARDSLPVVVAQLELTGDNPRGEGLTQ